jgi:hypothetical protein
MKLIRMAATALSLVFVTLGNARGEWVGGVSTSSAEGWAGIGGGHVEL